MQSKTVISLVGFTVMLGMSAPAYAYLDPATGSILLQAMIGAVGGTTLFFRTSLHKVKTLFSRQKQSERK